MSRRVAFVTGGSAGIGEAIARDLARDHLVVIASSNEARVNDAVSRLRRDADGVDLNGIRMDVASLDSVEAAVSWVVERTGGIDVLVNCAGVAGGGVTAEFSADDWNRIIAVNLSGVFLTTKYVLQTGGMLERRWGRVINIASTGGKQGVMYAAAYSASKHGVVGFTKSLGLELAKTGVTVNAVCPGFVESSMAAGARQRYAAIWRCSEDDAKQRIEARIPLGRYVVPNEVTGLVRYLASPDSAAVLAQAFNVCGGLGTY